ncbi:hypothetical protein [Paenibacillus cymbidii]|uniref:hypothetical protein n=1 Tax=Paenibacillus cymbidii TaxID=1639034 RepID=UPI0010807F96|nr:hypothetical protein [Paenibacillus cymbidii]
MAVFKAFSPAAEVNGSTVYSVLDGMGPFRTRGMIILRGCGITDLRPDGWYPQQAWLDAFHLIQDMIGPKTVYQIGKKIPENIQLPPGFDTIESALPLLDASYQMNHRGGEIGHIEYKQTGERSGTITCPNPMPCDFERGAFEAFTNKFRSRDCQPKVEHDPAAPCKKHGGETCTYHITW